MANVYYTIKNIIQSSISIVFVIIHVSFVDFYGFAFLYEIDHGKLQAQLVVLNTLIACLTKIQIRDILHFSYINTVFQFRV